MTEPKKYTHDDWLLEAERRFGPDRRGWRFVCPVCGHIAAVADWQDAGAPPGAVAFSCVGRYRYPEGKAPTGFSRRKPAGGCDYTGGGLFKLNPVEVADDAGRPHYVFDFAPTAGP